MNPQQAHALQSALAGPPESDQVAELRRKLQMHEETSRRFHHALVIRHYHDAEAEKVRQQIAQLGGGK